MDLYNLREDYTQAELKLEDLPNDPFRQFELWFQQACDSELQEPNAMVLATASAQAEPLVRTVLLKYFDRNGFVFFTNYESRKAHHIQENPHVALLFLWLPLQRQVQITGTAAKISTTESLKYFATRPRGSQLGAWCSPQSSVISSRQMLLMEFEAMKQKFRNQEVPLPPFWGGYRVVPNQFEFWQGRSNRLHDRFLYIRHIRQADESWKIQRLAP
ncbi:MAG: pyridoxamine 5'-phosphate oxidase [Leptolyngbya sp. IPPAS B-1204]|nr:MAG: pyridoxamine 5'-phosphate oxidase [Leptolyngbya sp. IPPAS B-1204]